MKLVRGSMWPSLVCALMLCSCGHTPPPTDAPLDTVSNGEPEAGGDLEVEADTSAANELTVKAIVERNIDSVVRVEGPGRAGTGFVLASTGVIATNLHVIFGQREANVILRDGRTFAVTHVLAVDPQKDLALLQIDADKLPQVTLGNSESVEVGDAVVAIGNPLGVLTHTVSDGLISSVREMGGLSLLQISAPISPGSSGGPLFNRRGEVIGIATLTSALGQNLNFGVPINYLKPMMTSTARVTLAEFGEKTSGPDIQRDIPRFDAAVLKKCSRSSQAFVFKSIEDAIAVGAPVYNQGNYEACYRVYEGATIQMIGNIKGCGRLKKELKKGLAKARKKEGAIAQAWALRDLFDGVIYLIAGAQR